MWSNDAFAISRRDAMIGASALLAAGLTAKTAAAQTATKYRRWNLSDPNCPPRVLESYKKAIRAMLALPVTDRRNWYRYTMIHTLDCPHGNWWFLPWHRGYLGYFEQICRELSGDPDFALPYWDWTKEPRVPAAMFDDVLDPNNDAFIASFTDFQQKYKDAIDHAGYWDVVQNPDGSVSPSPQYEQLLGRSIRFPEDLWFDIDNQFGTIFFPRGNARGLSAAEPGLVIPNKPPEEQSVLKAVSLPTILDALSPRDFLTFASPKALSHSFSSGFSVLENQPHNLVHNCVGGAYNGVGGFMQAFMSPTDPIFYLHHANMDRLWDVWTRKQLANRGPTLPNGSPPAGQPPVPRTDYYSWSREKFLFFVDAQGQPSSAQTAGDFAAIGAFDYDYSPGSGEEVVATTPQVAVIASLNALPMAVSSQERGGKVVTEAAASLPSSLIAREGETAQPKLFASVTVEPSAHEDLDVFLRTKSGARHFVATLSLFGHHHVTGPVTFQVPISTALANLPSAESIAANPSLNLEVVPHPRVAGETHEMEAMAPAAPGGPAAPLKVESRVLGVTLQQL